MNQEVRIRKTDKRSQEKPACVGFTTQDLAERRSTPAIWLYICAEIHSLAELKVVQYVMAHTCQDDWQPVELTIDEIANGRKYSDDPDEERMDFGTGLSEAGVRNGLALALQHGFLTCTVDDSNKSQIIKSYQLHMQEEVQSLYPDEYDETEQDIVAATEVYTLDPQSCEVYILDPEPQEATEVLTPVTEPIEPQYKDVEVYNLDPLRKNSKYSYINNNSNIFRNNGSHLNKLMEDLSRDLGDHEHIASNIGQARRLYVASGLDPDAFQELLYEAKDLARRASIKKVNSRGWANRMPYFFKCLRGMVRPNVTEIAS